MRLLLSLACWVVLGGVWASDNDKDNSWPHVGDIKKCPRCAAAFDAAPHPLDYRQCKKCDVALTKAMAYLKKNFKPQFFGLILDSFYGGFAFLMDGSGQNEKELAVCVKNCRDLIKKENEPQGGAATPTTVGDDYCSWKKSMAMYFLCEYSLRHGLTPENKASLLEGLQFAVDTQQPGGGWYHGKPRQSQYAPDIAIIGCIYYAAFLQMRTLGMEPGPVLDQTRAYLESISDGKTIGYSKGWKGGLGGGGAVGFITLGLQGSGNGDDVWGAGLANWMKQNYMDAPHGHANGELHYFGLGAGLHRLGAAFYAPFATCHLHRLIDLQREDGSLPKMTHDTSSEDEYYNKWKADKTTGGDYSATAVFACLLLMEQPGAFSPLPPKPPGSIPNKEAYKIATQALEAKEYARAFKHFSLVLPRGDSGELIPVAREQMRKIETEAKLQLQKLEARNAGALKPFAGGSDPKGELLAYAAAIKACEQFQKDFEGTTASGSARKLAEPLQKALSEKRMHLAFGGVNAKPAPGKADVAAARKVASDPLWDEKLRFRTRAALETGGKPRFTFKALASRVTVLSVEASGDLAVSVEKGGRLDLSWQQLQEVDKCSLAVELASTRGHPADHALAAYYLFAQSQEDRAREHLAKSGADGQRVRDTFQQ